MLPIRMTKRLLLYIASLLLAMPMWAWHETVTVGAGLTQTLPTSVDSRVQSVADALGLTLLGWTPGEIADGQRPATYYGLGATVTPVAETTYYAMFARANSGGELIVRQCPSPADGDTVLLAILQGTGCYVAPSGYTDDMILNSQNASYYGSLMAHSVMSDNTFTWKIVARPDNKFYLQSAGTATYYMYISSSTVKCGASTPGEFTINNGFLYYPTSWKYLTFSKDASGYIHLSLGTGIAPKTHTFAFYRKERYVDFATTIGQLPGCANCFIYVP